MYCGSVYHGIVVVGPCSIGVFCSVLERCVVVLLALLYRCIVVVVSCCRVAVWL